ncbi:probable glutamate--tRNA ligase, mitochondrial [Uloborus diversus]|uniref:probable glutamate--tRNA ligase, mitochondrial n=1 Tax=Uloborus diversus TaxID=327109 RepID=UPI00240A0A90|nr:probable glutamate--tRNA ligase, mitochondrial [Uloborus diversus]
MWIRSILKFNFKTAGLRHCYSDVRVRFAPSPTGCMHLGGLRTAFYNYLFAKKNKGKFILRIEDTDQKRVKAESISNFHSVLQWTGLIPDEGPDVGGSFGPYIQSERLKLYQENAEILVKSGSAYRCFCSETRLELLRKESMRNRQNRGYDNKCRHLTASEIEDLMSKNASFTIRFRIPDKSISHDDLIFGNYTYNVAENEGDFIILKSDGFPTYHFACVIDDHAMRISHVLRGMEWLISTPKHIMMFHTFGWNPPKYAHLPLLVNSDRTKLSKRQESVSIEYFKEKGYFPEALLNFLAVAGGGFGKQEGCIVYDLDTLCSKFDVESMNTNSCIVDLRKLDLFNHNYLAKQLENHHSVNALIQWLRTALRDKYGKRYEGEESNISDAYIKKILLCHKDRINNLLELMSDDMEYLWTQRNVDSVISTLSELKVKDTALQALPSVAESLSNVSETEFNEENTVLLVKDVSKQLKVPYAHLMRALRIVLTGKKDGPGVGEILFMLGKERSLEKIESVVLFSKAILKENKAFS